MKTSTRTALLITYSIVLLAAMSASIRAAIALALGPDTAQASQILLGPFVTAALIYMNRRKIFHRVEWAVRGGLAVLALGIVLFVAGKTAGTSLAAGDQLSLMISALVALWLGGFLLCFGSAAFKTGLFPLLFLLICIPLPSVILDRSITILQHGSAEMSYVLLKFSGIPVYREGVTFTFSNLIMIVAPECSGIRSAIAIVITCLLAGHLMLRSTWRKGLLIAVAVPLLMFKNAVRITMLSLLAVYVDPRILTSALHREGGIPFFLLGLVLLYPVLKLPSLSQPSLTKM